MTEWPYNATATILNPPPYEPVPRNRYCPAKLRIDREYTDGEREVEVWPCQSIIRAGRTKHRNAHNFRKADR